jgi:hypothetical protein
MGAPTARQTFRETVALVAAKAKARLPQTVNGRIEAAARLVVNGDVELLADGSINVGGSDPTRYYHLVGPTCTCTDFTQGKAPEGWCKHRIAAGIAKRVGELLPQEASPEGVSPAYPLPEAPSSCNVYLTIGGHKVQVTLRDTDEQRMLARLQILLEQYPTLPVQPLGPQGQGKDWCQQHGVQMKENVKDGRRWYSHQVDGHWCKGRGVAHG